MLRSVRTVLVLAATLVFIGGCSNDDSASAWGASADRLGMLHELSQPSWPLRGAEQAAEILAWGLLEELIRLVRIGDPARAQIAAGYELLPGLSSPTAGG